MQQAAVQPAFVYMQQCMQAQGQGGLPGLTILQNGGGLKRGRSPRAEMVQDPEPAQWPKSVQSQKLQQEPPHAEKDIDKMEEMIRAKQLEGKSKNKREAFCKPNSKRSASKSDAKEALRSPSRKRSSSYRPTKALRSSRHCTWKTARCLPSNRIAECRRRATRSPASRCRSPTRLGRG